jgi:prepilin-type N-terminal cleavage/methylation domain-containing protein
MRLSGQTAGFTLVEVMVAMLMISFMATTVFNVALTVKTGSAKNERKLQALAGARQVASQLKNYVTGDPESTAIPGPGMGTNSWSMDGNGIDDLSCMNCYALTPGNHILTGVLSSEFEAPPYNARVSYTVTVIDTIKGRPVPAVSVTTTWTNP